MKFDKNLTLITISDPNIDPRNLLDRFLRSEDGPEEFVPVVTIQRAERKKAERISWQENKISEGKTDAEKKQAMERLETLRKMTTEEFVKSWYGVTVFDKSTNSFGYLGNPNAYMEDYNLGDDVLPTVNGEFTNTARTDEIDWNKLKELAGLKSELELLNRNVLNTDGSEFIATRTKVHMRPAAFVGKDGKWYQEDNMDEDVHLSIKKYQEAWEKAIQSAKPSDIFTHWNFAD